MTKAKKKILEQGWKERLAKEYSQTKERYEKIHKTIVKLEAGTCPFESSCSLDLLKRQAKAIGKYLFILEVRAEQAGIVLQD
ncbi:MAG: hypothetical protein E7027_04385 [Elusimicrobium sp.]|uniref:Uncharacterized protein n=1 Tax=Candidatus Avelusimicrobium gallicola TaxID=2562704 RepID=A0A928DRH6_9BACT|nr:hypothetical protein [Elusimicrobium sp.]